MFLPQDVKSVQYYINYFRRGSYNSILYTINTLSWLIFTANLIAFRIVQKTHLWDVSKGVSRIQLRERICFACGWHHITGWKKAKKKKNNKQGILTTNQHPFLCFLIARFDMASHSLFLLSCFPFISANPEPNYNLPRLLNLLLHHLLSEP